MDRRYEPINRAFGMPTPKPTAEERAKIVWDLPLGTGHATAEALFAEQIRLAIRQAFEEAAEKIQHEAESWWKEMELCKGNDEDYAAARERRQECVRMAEMVRALAKEKPDAGV